MIVWRREALPAKTERVQGIYAFFFNKEGFSDPEILRQLLISYLDFISSSLFSSLPTPGRKAVGFIMILTFDLIRQGRNDIIVRSSLSIIFCEVKGNITYSVRR